MRDLASILLDLATKYEVFRNTLKLLLKTLDIFIDLMYNYKAESKFYHTFRLFVAYNSNGEGYKC